MNVSICIATYNGAKFLDAQLSSIISQLQNGDEVLVADDASTDGTINLIRKYEKNGVKLLATERVGGVVPNFERLILASACDVVALCDQDDVWLPGRLDLIRDRLKKADLVVLNGIVVDEEMNSISESIFEFIGIRQGFFRNFIKNSFVGCCMAFKSTLKERLLPFPGMLPWHDWYIGLVASIFGRVVYVEERTMLYRRHSTNASQTGKPSQNSLWRKISMRIVIAHAVFVASSR